MKCEAFGLSNNTKMRKNKGKYTHACVRCIEFAANLTLVKCRNVGEGTQRFA